MSETNAEKYIGQTRTMNCGMSATIIDYRSYKDIDVQFEDRTIREHVSISAFNRRNISPPSTSIQPGNKHIGQTRTMNCGLKATVIAYRNYKDVDVKFENGIVRKHRGLDEFERQAISPIPPRKGKAIIGKTKIMNCGMKATITDYRNMNDIDVRFENGVIRKHIRMNSFNTCTIGLKDKFNSDSYIGQTNIMKCGMKATIIAYRKMDDIDVRFEDGTIRKHMHIHNFYNYSLSIKPKLTDKAYLGQTKLMNCGMKATIISYRAYTDIDIQFEDGTIRQHVAVRSFNKGAIGKVANSTKADYINSTNTMTNGLRATIITYRRSDDIDVQFEDGVICKHTSVGAFNRGLISHPTKRLFDKYEISKVAFAFHNKTYFYVTYTENNIKITDIMCIDDMKQKLPASA